MKESKKILVTFDSKLDISVYTLETIINLGLKEYFFDGDIDYKESEYIAYKVKARGITGDVLGLDFSIENERVVKI